MEKGLTIPKHLKRFFKDLRNDVSGGVLVWATAALPAVLGGAALAVDVSRIYNLEAQLQAAADSYARAGAAELDGRGDSLVRADRAIRNLVKNEENFSTSAGVVEIESIRYLTGTPADGFSVVGNDYKTADPHSAKYVEVTVKPRVIQTILPPKISMAATKLTLDATSMAGFTSGACGAQPMFVCNPYEGTGISIFEAAEDEFEAGKQLRLTNPGGGNGKFGPGTWGYLDPFSQNGATPAEYIKDQLAKDETDACYDSTGVRPRTGKIAGIDEAINVRFDMYKGQFKKPEYTEDNAFAPAANVTRGYALSGKGNGNVCGATESELALGLPRDGSLSDDNYIGAGTWDFVSYMALNHNMASPVYIAGTNYHIDYVTGTYSPSTPPSRYDVYRWEIDSDLIPGEGTYGDLALTAEEGRPVCHDLGAYQGDIDRRVITAAIVDCGEDGENIDEADKNSSNLPVVAFGRFFLTEPAGVDDQAQLHMEFIELIDGEDTLSRDRVSLSR